MHGEGDTHNGWRCQLNVTQYAVNKCWMRCWVRRNTTYANTSCVMCDGLLQENADFSLSNDKRSYSTRIAHIAPQSTKTLCSSVLCLSLDKSESYMTMPLPVHLGASISSCTNT